METSIGRSASRRPGRAVATKYPVRVRPERERRHAGPIRGSEPAGATPYRGPASLVSAQWAPDAPTWLMTLSDLTLLLFCFLGLWYVTDGKQRDRKTAAGAPEIIVSAPAVVPAAPGRDDFAVPQDWNTVSAELESVIAESGLGPNVSFEIASRDLVISIHDTVSFASGKTVLRARALPILDKVAALMLSRTALLVEVSGHTDSRRISTARFPSNWELSTARASRVARYFAAKGVDAARIAVQGYAAERPRMLGTDPDSERANRRVEIRLYQSAAPASHRHEAQS